MIKFAAHIWGREMTYLKEANDIYNWVVDEKWWHLILIWCNCEGVLMIEIETRRIGVSWWVRGKHNGWRSGFIFKGLVVEIETRKKWVNVNVWKEKWTR